MTKLATAIVVLLVASILQAQDVEEMLQRQREMFAEGRRMSENGKRLFGEAEGPTLDGTLVRKLPADYMIGDWGRAQFSFKTMSKVSATECLIMPSQRKATTPMLLRGLDMSKVTDGIKFILPHPVVINDTYTYRTASGGQLTVLVLDCRKEKLKKLLDQERERLKAAEAKKWQDRWVKEKRTWTSKSGKFSVDALYDADLGKGKIRLLKKDMSEIIVALSKLSEADRREAIKLRKASLPKKKRGSRKK